MEFKSKIENFNGKNATFGGYFIVPDSIVQEIKKNKIKRLLCKLNNSIEYSCAIMPLGNGIYFINVNKDIRKKVGVIIGSEIEVILKPDESKYGIPLPEEMEELLKMDEEANHIFHTLTKGKQRSLLYIIGKPKNTDSRLNKAVLITRYLKLVNGKLDFKEMTEYLKINKI